MKEDLSPRQVAQLKHQELLLEEKKLALVEGLPHRYGWKWYPWARRFYESQNRMNLLVAANQLGKSSSQIRKCIEWATNRSLWPKLWKTQPRQFWYLYPNKEMATVEFDKKWVPEFLPRNQFSQHADYGWRVDKRSRFVEAVHFNTGVTVYFKTYAQNAQALQASSVHAIFCDEELPEELYAELAMRLSATTGHFSMVFTATLNQEFWRKAMEGRGKNENFPDAFKQNVSLYDCMFYEDGSPGMYDEERIKKIEAMCGTESEIQRRVYGRFVASTGRVYPSFDPSKHYVSDFRVKPEHKIYAGIDPGGGGNGSPAAIVFLAVEEDGSKGTVFRSWRGDGMTTTNGDVFDKYRELKGNLNVTMAVYDPGAKDFGTIASRIGEPINKANKNHEVGEGLVNTLFRSGMLFIEDTEENKKLGSELLSLMFTKFKHSAFDDLCDALRYCVICPGWDFSKISLITGEPEKVVESRPLTKEEYLEWEMRARRGLLDEKERNPWGDLEDEISFWNGEFGNS